MFLNFENNIWRGLLNRMGFKKHKPVLCIFSKTGLLFWRQKQTFLFKNSPQEPTQQLSKAQECKGFQLVNRWNVSEKPIPQKRVFNTQWLDLQHTPHWDRIIGMFPKTRLKEGRGNLYRALGNFQFLLNVVHLRERHITPPLDKEIAKSNYSSAPQYQYSRRKWELDKWGGSNSEWFIAHVLVEKPSRHKANHDSAIAAVRAALYTNVDAKTMHLKILASELFLKRYGRVF